MVTTALKGSIYGWKMTRVGNDRPAWTEGRRLSDCRVSLPWEVEVLLAQSLPFQKLTPNEETEKINTNTNENDRIVNNS